MLTKLLIPIAVAGTLLSPGVIRAAPATQTTASPVSQTAPQGAVLPLLGFQICVGAVQADARCDVRLPDLRAATPAEPPQPTWFTLLGKTVCLGEPQGRTCDLRLPPPAAPSRGS